MNGPQDLGGQMGFGPIAPETDEPVFHADWERRAMALTMCAGGMGHWSIDESRHARESLPPAEYYRSSYYEIWTAALEHLLLRHGFVTPADLAAGTPVDPSPTPRRVLDVAGVATLLARGSPTSRPLAQRPKFAAGAAVRTRNMHPRGHTRLPRYARGRLGTIAAVHEAFVFPDSRARNLGENPEFLYTVAFPATELWGADGDPSSTVSIDAFESYLEPA